MLSIQEISDRLEIQDLITSYCTVVDKKNWKGYREIFLEDASVDYSGSGGLSGSVDEVIDYLDTSLGYQKELG
ncbi:MAG: nuclear transport factor 2 family protein, partial [Porticoccaceae bacterium]